MKLELSRLHFPVTTLGPGRRIGIWFQGCSIRCEGCISADTWGSGRGGTTVENVIEALAPWFSSAEGITISGGEPFDQASALHLLLNNIKGQTAIDILVYSGYPLELIGEKVRAMDGLIDALITDPYDSRASQTLMLRGSDNQRLHLLTRLGTTRFAGFNRTSHAGEMTLDVMFDEDGAAWIAGIPRPGDMQRLTQILADQGHKAVTSQATSVRGKRICD
jgi:anaerobic ribonucleoside-triphosphate reductase activating protein